MCDSVTVVPVQDNGSKTCTYEVSGIGNLVVMKNGHSVGTVTQGYPISVPFSNGDIESVAAIPQNGSTYVKMCPTPQLVACTTVPEYTMTVTNYHELPDKVTAYFSGGTPGGGGGTDTSLILAVAAGILGLSLLGGGNSQPQRRRRRR